MKTDISSGHSYIKTSYFLFVFFNYQNKSKIDRKNLYEAILNDVMPITLGISTKIKLGYDALGSPYLNNERFEISISHSHDLGIIGITYREYDLGIDIQFRNESLNVRSLLDIKECQIIQEKNISPTSIVSLKESLGKWFNIGLLGQKDFYSIDEIIRISKYANISVYMVKYHFFRFLLGFSLILKNGYVISLTVNNKELLVLDILDNFCKELNYGIHVE